MKRIRLRQLQMYKSQHGRTQPVHPSYQDQFHPVWQNDYYHFKEQLYSIQRRNVEMNGLLAQYQMNSSVFNLRQLQELIKINCRKIDQIDQWANNFPYTNISHLQNQLENNIVKHFKQSILKCISVIFMIREQINIISSQQEMRERSFALNQSANMSFSALNTSQNQNLERSRAIKEVTSRIQNLNAILRRMGDVVASQGDHINRIDQNLRTGHSNVKMGRQLLAARAARQAGQQDDENSTCNFSNKVNSIITTLYLIDLALIGVLVIKNL